MPGPSTEDNFLGRGPLMFERQETKRSHPSQLKLGRRPVGTVMSEVD